MNFDVAIDIAHPPRRQWRGSSVATAARQAFLKFARYLSRAAGRGLNPPRGTVLAPLSSAPVRSGYVPVNLQAWPEGDCC